MPPRQWKVRLADMREAAERIQEYCAGKRDSKAFSEDTKTFDACIRNLQVLGDAAAKVPVEIQRAYPKVPWKRIKGMRNILVHEYFGVSPSVVWNTIKNELPKLATTLREISDYFEKPAHPWKICPPGEHYVRDAKVNGYFRGETFVSAHLRRDHCRESRGSGKDFLTLGEVQDIAGMHFPTLSGAPKPLDLGFGKKGLKYDSFIRGWVKYWNDVLRPTPELDANLVKALIASESSFDELSGKGKRKSAKGLLQLMPKTIRYLNGEENELRDQIFEFADSQVFDASLNICAGVRWLFRKRETATGRLGRQATWEEAVEEYKDYLHRRLKNPKLKLKGMEIFRKQLAKLHGKKI